MCAPLTINVGVMSKAHARAVDSNSVEAENLGMPSYKASNTKYDKLIAVVSTEAFNNRNGRRESTEKRTVPLATTKIPRAESQRERERERGSNKENPACRRRERGRKRGREVRRTKR